MADNAEMHQVIYITQNTVTVVKQFNREYSSYNQFLFLTILLFDYNLVVVLFVVAGYGMRKCLSNKSKRKQVPFVTAPVFDGAWCQRLFDDVDGLVLWC